MPCDFRAYLEVVPFLGGCSVCRTSPRPLGGEVGLSGPGEGVAVLDGSRKTPPAATASDLPRCAVEVTKLHDLCAGEVTGLRVLPTQAFLVPCVLLAMISSTGSYCDAEVITFDSLTVPAAGFYNGNIASTGPERDNFTIVGTRTVTVRQSSVQDGRSMALLLTITIPISEASILGADGVGRLSRTRARPGSRISTRRRPGGGAAIRRPIW